MHRASDLSPLADFVDRPDGEELALFDNRDRVADLGELRENV